MYRKREYRLTVPKHSLPGLEPYGYYGCNSLNVQIFSSAEFWYNTTYINIHKILK